jgi:hypothetical protein
MNYEKIHPASINLKFVNQPNIIEIIVIILIIILFINLIIKMIK